MKLKKTPWGKSLVHSHLNKADHNFKFSETINQKYNDWIIITLYFALYHACLALVANKGYISKSHNDTLEFIKKNYVEINTKELKLLNQLYLTKEDVEFYVNLKENRKNASYLTNTLFKDKKIKLLKEKTYKFITKIKFISQRIH